MAYDKIVDSAQLDSIFTDIADAVRKRGGTSDEINHTSIADAVLTIPVTVENAWEKYSCGLTYLKGYSVVVARVSNDSVLPAGSVGITLYKEIVYDESTNTFSGGEIVLSYTQNEDKYNGDILLAEEQIPDKAYIYNGLWYETRPDTRLYVEKMKNYADGSYFMTATITPLDKVTGYGKGEFVGNVVSDIANAYPDSGVQDGFYYEKIKLASDSHDYVWEKYEANITETALTALNCGTYYSSSFIYYSYVGNWYFYPKIAFNSNGAIVASGSATSLLYSNLTSTYFYDGDVIYDASKIPDGYYFTYNGVIYKTTASTRLVAKLNGSYVYAQFVNVIKVDGSLTLLTHIASDNSSEYPDAGVADDGFYYKKVLPLSLETDLVSGNIRSGVNILGVTGTYIRDSDSDLIPANIKKGVNIYGVTGTYEGESASNEKVTITFSSTSYLYSFIYQNDGSVLKSSGSGSYTVDKGSMFALFLKRTGSAPTVSGASYKQYYGTTAYASKSTSASTVYIRLYTYLADSDMTLSC